MKPIGIQTPCSENWNDMSPSEKGAFCKKCASHVHDFTQKSTAEIKDTLRSMLGQKVCGRMTVDQEIALNAEFEAWEFQSKRDVQRAMVFALVVVFGLTLFSCSDKQDEQKVQEIQAIAMQAMNNQTIGETKTVPAVEAAIEPPVFEIPVMYEEVVPDAEYVVEAKRMDLEEVEITNTTEIYLPTEIHRIEVLGGVCCSSRYTEYLEATKEEVKIEYDENGRIIPTEFAAIAFPNPTADRTTFELGVPDKTRFEIALYDMNGKLVQEVYNGKIDRGTFTQELQLGDLNPGIYLLIISSKDYKETVRISKI